jgi:hypothetical protein
MANKINNPTIYRIHLRMGLAVTKITWITLMSRNSIVISSHVSIFDIKSE